MKWFILFSLLLIILMAGCTTNTDVSKDCADGAICDIKDMQESSAPEVNKEVEKVEVYHFHGTNQCFSCKTVGAFAEKTVNTYYKDLLDSGKMIFASVNAELPENRDLAVKYGATGSSLWIGTYVNGEFNKEENTNVWYKIRNEEDYLSYLKGLLDKRLAGDLS